ncbi:MAG: L-threonylcarbamoyladenylate synthase [Pseudomonadota bacterium]
MPHRIISHIVLSHPDIVPVEAGLTRATDALRAGQLVGMPTETVYGLAADATNPAAVAGVFAAKGRPSFNPLIAHCGSIEQAVSEGVFDERAHRLAAAFWPGPLTLIVPVGGYGSVCELARAGLETIGLRIPRHPVALELLSAVSTPLAAPSANPSGKISPTTARDVANAFGSEVSLVLEGGACEAGIESTIVAVLPDTLPTILRPGVIDRTSISDVVGELQSNQSANAVIAPGQLSSHYAPGAEVRLNASDARPGEVLLGFGPNAPAGAANLSDKGDTVEAAANLYRMLRDLDDPGITAIAVMPIPRDGLGEAINDRLRRAAAPRSQPSAVASP